MSLEIHKRLELDAPPERVWQALTDRRELALWFPDREADFEAEAGYTGAFVWEKQGAADDDADCAGGSYAVRIEKAEPHHTLVWSWAREADTPIDDARTTRVEWKLTPREEGGTLLELRETGFENLAAREQNNGGWDHELGELVQLLDRENAHRRTA
jgi:uncharacterized protein YndB with AHSA1/START domain